MSLPVAFFAHLNDKDIRYCHWKSTHRLEQGLAGETDLDLLVDGRQAGQLRLILAQLDFKPVLSAPHRQYPAVADYLGMDPSTGRLVHLHVHYRLVLGEQFVKNYYLPLENVFLSNTTTAAGIRLPVPELELIVLVLRALLKYRDRDLLRDLLRMGRPGLPGDILTELGQLEARTTQTGIREALESAFDFVDRGVVFDFLEVIGTHPRSGWRLWKLRRAVRSALTPFQRYGRLQARLKYYSVLWSRGWLAQTLARPFGAGKKKIPATGGFSVAFLGADGAGKSTVIKAVVKWLAWRLEAGTLYMGNSRPSPANSIIRSIAGFLAKIDRVSQRVPVWRRIPWSLFGPAAFFFAQLRFIADGRDRLLRFRRGQKRVARGGITIYDRYPLPGVTILGRFMDGPRIALNTSGRPGQIWRTLARIEERIYRQIRPPDNMFVLKIRPEVSLERKPGHRVDRLEAKTQAVEGIADDGIHRLCFDAEKPLEEVLLQVKTALWKLL